MRKGVSPVVATVLLIAIAVISAVAVWYWVAPLTSAQPTPSTTQTAYVVTSTYKNTSNSAQCATLDLMNSGGIVIAVNTIFEVRYQANGTSAARYINITTALSPGSTSNFNITSAGWGNQSALPLGTYTLRASTMSSSSISGFSDVYFTC